MSRPHAGGKPNRRREVSDINRIPQGVRRTRSSTGKLVTRRLGDEQSTAARNLGRICRLQPHMESCHVVSSHSALRHLDNEATAPKDHLRRPSCPRVRRPRSSRGTRNGSAAPVAYAWRIHGRRESEKPGPGAQPRSTMSCRMMGCLQMTRKSSGRKGRMDMSFGPMPNSAWSALRPDPPAAACL